MADKGFAAAQATFPVLSLWGFGDFAPILFCWSLVEVAHLCEPCEQGSKGWSGFPLSF